MAVARHPVARTAPPAPAIGVGGYVLPRPAPRCLYWLHVATFLLQRGRAARSGFLLGLLPAGILHFALVKAHGRASMSASRLKGLAIP